jgi:hypothetical protein
MPRTEKKFGQVRRAASGQLHELVPIASTTRNVLLNLTSNTSTTAATVITTTGAISRVVNSASITSSSSNFATRTNVSYTYALSHSGTIAVQIDNGAAVRFGVTFTPSTMVFSGGTAVTDTSFGPRISAVTTQSSVLSDVTPGQTTCFTNSLKFLDDDVFVSCPFINLEGLVASFNANTDQKMYAIFSTSLQSLATGFNISAAGSAGIGKTLAEVALGRAYIRPWGIYSLNAGGGTVGLGYILGSTNALSDQVPAGSGTEAEALAMIVIKNGIDVGHVWWDSVAGRTSGDALAFFQTSDVNSLTLQSVFSHTTNPSNPWLSRNASGKSGTAFSSTSTPFLPTRHAPAGFRIVENDGTQGANRFWLDGSVTLPAAPTGVNVPTAAQLLAAGLYCPVAATKFSPNGYYLAVAYNVNNGSSVAQSRVVIYSKQSDNTWVHTHSSGTSVTISPAHNDAMVWAPDSATISIATNGVIQTWSPGSLTQSPKPLNLATTLSLSGIYPNVPSIASVAATDTYLLGASVDTLNNASSNSAATKELLAVDRGSGTTAAFLLLYNTTSDTSTSTLATDPYTTHAYAVVASAGTTYQNTVAQSITCSSGSVIQISNIVLSPGEGLYVEPATTGRLEAVAYGVEIT